MVPTAGNQEEPARETAGDSSSNGDGAAAAAFADDQPHTAVSGGTLHPSRVGPARAALRQASAPACLDGPPCADDVGTPAATASAAVAALAAGGHGLSVTAAGVKRQLPLADQDSTGAWWGRESRAAAAVMRLMVGHGGPQRSLPELQPPADLKRLRTSSCRITGKLKAASPENDISTFIPTPTWGSPRVGSADGSADGTSGGSGELPAAGCDPWLAHNKEVQELKQQHAALEVLLAQAEQQVKGPLLLEQQMLTLKVQEQVSQQGVDTVSLAAISQGVSGASRPPEEQVERLAARMLAAEGGDFQASVGRLLHMVRQTMSQDEAVCGADGTQQQQQQLKQQLQRLSDSAASPGAGEAWHSCSSPASAINGASVAAGPTAADLCRDVSEADMAAQCLLEEAIHCLMTHIPMKHSSHSLVVHQEGLVAAPPAAAAAAARPTAPEQPDLQAGSPREWHPSRRALSMYIQLWSALTLQKHQHFASRLLLLSPGWLLLELRVQGVSADPPDQETLQVAQEVRSGRSG
eukprot:gene6527-6755_t